MRVLMVQPTGLSGIWHYANALASALRSQGAEVVLATQEPFEELGPLAGAPVVIIGRRGVESSGWSRRVPLRRRLVHHLSKLVRFCSLIRTYQPHVVHFHAPLGTLDFAYYKFCKMMGASVVVTAHDAQALSGRTHWGDSARYRAADHVWVHSASCYRHLRSRGLEASRVSRISHGNYLHLCQNATLDRREARDRLGVPREARLALFFGAISPYKGLGLLLEAFARVSTVDSNAHLMIVGEALHPFDEYGEQIRNLKLEDRVTVRLEYVRLEDFAGPFRAANIVVLPYLRISQSGILQLAYGFGRALVVTAVGGIGEAVLEDSTGVVVKSNDSTDLANGILRLFAAPELADAMGCRARQLAETKYAWERIAAETLDVYRNLARANSIPQSARRSKGIKPSASDDPIHPSHIQPYPRR